MFQKLDDFVKANYYSSEGLLVCSICEYSNKTSTNVRTHIETHNAPESLKRVQCLYCGYVCPSRSALRMHVKKHQS